MNNVRIGIVGYGNLGKGVEKAISLTKDMETVAIFTRRDPSQLKSLGAKVEPMEALIDYGDKIDICILCGGSATDLIEQGPEVVKYFDTVDSFDTHAKIPEYFSKMDEIARSTNHLCLISTGWDPGLFSINRVLSEAIIPNGETYTFWGKGVSQGHSDAIRRIAGVKNAIQYTIPNEDVKQRIRDGEKLTLTTRDKHYRDCFVVAEEGADKKAIEQAIVTMPNYFSDYDTMVHFISEEELLRDHAGMPHGGTVVRQGETSEGVKQIYEFNLYLDSNPEFTSSVNVACARALFKMKKENKKGAYTILDVPIGYFSPKSPEELRKTML